MDLLRILEIALEVVGSASVVAGLLRQVLPFLRGYAETTATNADNAAVEAASIGLSMFTMFAEGLHKISGMVALNPQQKKEAK